MKFILGLGNPGKKYERTRHNLGFLVIDYLAQSHSIGVTREKHCSLVGEWRFNDEKVLLVKPQTYMNLSGQVAQSLKSYYQADPQDFIVIHDDLDLPFGTLRIRPRGSAGGHRGIASMIQELQDENFFRIRIGLGRPPEGVDSASYVLEPFSAGERRQLPEILSTASAGVETLLREGPARAMAKFNRKGQSDISDVPQ